MIGVIFKYLGDIIEVRVDGTTVLFRTSQSIGFTDISGLKLDRAGVVKEFPDLRGNEDWRKIAIERFKEKIRDMETEEERIQYIMEDLIKHGYKPLYLNKQGFRPVKL